MLKKDLGTSLSICVVTLGLLLNGCSSTPEEESADLEATEMGDQSAHKEDAAGDEFYTEGDMSSDPDLAEEDLEEAGLSGYENSEPLLGDNAEDNDAWGQSTDEVSVVESSNTDAPVLDDMLDPNTVTPSTAGLPVYEPTLPEAADDTSDVADISAGRDEVAYSDSLGEASGWSNAAVGADYGDYIVRPGDSLAKIAKAIFKDGNRWRELVVENRDDPTLIYPGDVVQYPLEEASAQEFAARYNNIPRTQLTVTPGDSLSTIASRIYGNQDAWKILVALNKDRITNPNRILVGMELQYIEPSQFPKLALQR